MKLLDPLTRRLAVGLLLALVLAVGAGWSVLAGFRARLDDAQSERQARVLVQQLAELVEATGFEDAAVGEVVELYSELHPTATAVRVIDLGRKRLMASTAASDVAGQAAPRRLGMEEKALFDLGQSLRAAVEVNREEGRSWKPEIVAEQLVDGGFLLAAPVERQETIVGVALVETTVHAPQSRSGAGIALLAVALPVFLFLGLASVLAGGDRRVLAGILAVVCLVGSLWAWGSRTTTLLTAGALEAELALDQRLETEAERFRLLLEGLGRDAAAASLEPSRWDVDEYRRPAPSAAIGAAREVRRLHKLLATTGSIGLLLLLAVGTGATQRLGGTLVRHRRAYGYAFPAVIAMVVLVYLPFLYGVLLSFTNANIYNSDQPITETWVGLENYIDILDDFEVVRQTPTGRVVDYQSFYWTLGFTVVWTVSNLAIGVGVGLGLALILHRQGLFGKPIYRVIFILPWAVPNYITSLIWKGMFHSQLGVVNQIVQLLGLEPVSWFEHPFSSFLTVLATNGWLSFPFMMVVSLGALQSIPADLYEAAEVDGASGWQRFRSITLPSLEPALVPAVILSAIWTFNMFNIIYLVSGGQPAQSTEILITQAYKIAFEQYRYGYAAAYSMLIFLILLVYGVWQNRVTRATEGM